MSEFNLFVSAIGLLEGKPAIAIINSVNDRTHIAWLDAAKARALANYLNQLAAEVERLSPSPSGMPDLKEDGVWQESLKAADVDPKPMTFAEAKKEWREAAPPKRKVKRGRSK